MAGRAGVGGLAPPSALLSTSPQLTCSVKLISVRKRFHFHWGTGDDCADGVITVSWFITRVVGIFFFLLFILPQCGHTDISVQVSAEVTAAVAADWSPRCSV